MVVSLLMLCYCKEIEIVCSAELTDFHETSYECHVRRSHPALGGVNFLPSATPT